MGVDPAPPPPNLLTARNCYESQSHFRDSAHRHIVGCIGSGFLHDQPDTVRCGGCFRFGSGRLWQLYQQFDFDGGRERGQYGDTRWFRRHGIRLPQHDFDGQRFGHERGAFAAGGGIGAAGSYGGNSKTNENANALSGGVSATIVLGANHYTASSANDQGNANAGAAGLTGSAGSGAITGSNHYNSSTVWSTGSAGSPSASGGSNASSSATGSSH